MAKHMDAPSELLKGVKSINCEKVIFSVVLCLIILMESYP